MLRQLATRGMHFCRKGNLKASLPERADFRLFHSGTDVWIPNSAKPANALFRSFLARNP
jgi:hypothetical protein